MLTLRFSAYRYGLFLHTAQENRLFLGISATCYNTTYNEVDAFQSATAQCDQNRIHLDFLQSSCPRTTIAAASGRLGFSRTDLVAPVSVDRNLGIYLDSDTSMRSHVAKTASSCFSILRHLRSIRRSVLRPILQSMVVSLVLSRLDFGNATLTGAPAYLLQRLQSVMNAAARLIFSSSRFDHISPLLSRLHCSRLQSCSGIPMSTRFGADIPVR